MKLQGTCQNGRANSARISDIRGTKKQMKDNGLIKYYTEAKLYAKQIIKVSFDEVLYGTFKIPSQEEVEQALKNVVDYRFNEYRVRLRIKAKNLGWNKDRIDAEVDKIKFNHDNECLSNLRQAAAQGVTEIENLITDLQDTIKTWKIKNLV